MRGLRIVSRIYLSLAAIATAVLWFFPFSAFDLEKLCKSLHAFIGEANGTFLESVEEVKNAQQFLLISRIVLIALLCLAVFFGLRAITNHCLGYIFFIIADVVALAGAAVTAFTINDKIGSDVLEFSYFFYVLVIVVIWHCCAIH